MQPVNVLGNHRAGSAAVDEFGDGAVTAVWLGAAPHILGLKAAARFGHPDKTPRWWRTPLGQSLAVRVGHPTAEAVTYPVAGAMLGITRQGVHDLVTRGKLARHPTGGVLTTSVRDRLRNESHRS